MAGKGGGAWKVAYADFVTAMMAFFLVMWIVGQSKQVRQSVAQYFRDPDGYNVKTGKPGDPPVGDPFSVWPQAPQGGRGPHDGDGEGQGESKKNRRPQRFGATTREKGFFALHNGDQQMRGLILLFPEDSAELDPAAIDRLKSLVPNLLGKRNKIEIRAHTSRRPLPPGSPFVSLWQLCYARCLATMKYLEANGVESDRFRLSLAGPHEPYTTQADESLQLNNSRVEVYVLGELVEDLVGTPEERETRNAVPFNSRVGDEEEPDSASESSSDSANDAESNSHSDAAEHRDRGA